MTTPARGKDRPLFGLRGRPGRLALALFRMPLNAYRHDAGALLGRRHAGRVAASRSASSTTAPVAMR